VTTKKPETEVKRRTVARKAKAKTPAPPSADDIAARAHQLFLQRGGAHGYDREDWLLAERELQSAGG
jgi:hypothetical protein